MSALARIAAGESFASVVWRMRRSARSRARALPGFTVVTFGGRAAYLYEPEAR